MLKKWWLRRQEGRDRKKQKDVVEIVEARREVEHGHPDPGLSDAEKLPPIFKNTDWTGGGPL